ncbi:MAG: YciI family protein [Nocardioidaceae bacterium]
MTDGPFTETAEQVGGFYVVETDDLEDLLDCCTIIAAVGDGIEVRRTVDPAERPS